MWQPPRPIERAPSKMVCETMPKSISEPLMGYCVFSRSRIYAEGLSVSAGPFHSGSAAAHLSVGKIRWQLAG